MSQPLPRFRQRQDEAERLRRIARICVDTDTPMPNPALGYRTAPGDQRRLRYIPVHARGVGGTIPGTDPLAQIIAAEQRNNRAA